MHIENFFRYNAAFIAFDTFLSMFSYKFSSSLRWSAENSCVHNMCSEVFLDLVLRIFV